MLLFLTACFALHVVDALCALCWHYLVVVVVSLVTFVWFVCLFVAGLCLVYVQLKNVAALVSFWLDMSFLICRLLPQHII